MAGTAIGITTASDTVVVGMGEGTPLLSGDSSTIGSGTNRNGSDDGSVQYKVWEFLAAKTKVGQQYEKFMIGLIAINVIAFIFGTLFVAPYNNNEDNIKSYSWSIRGSEDAICDTWCDTLWFGNYEDNYLAFLGIGTTSVLELITIFIFTIEYFLRVWTCPYEYVPSTTNYVRLKYICTNFFSLVDLASTVPFYVDVFLFTSSDAVGSTSFLRMFRMFRMMRVDGGKYDSALSLVDDVYRAQKSILGTAAFIGATTWIVISSLYYLVERKNSEMIYCPQQNCPDLDDDVDTSLCVIDTWGLVDCTPAGCPSTLEDGTTPPCWNLYQSIPMASYYTLLNLFGEFPLFDQHSPGGQVVGTITAVVAVTFFALPVGIIGNGFETEISKRRKNTLSSPIVERQLFTPGFLATGGSCMQASIFNFFFPMTTKFSYFCDTYFINFLVIGTAITFMIDTIDVLPKEYRIVQSYFEFFAVIVFTLEYVFKLYGITIDPMYNNNTNSNSNSGRNSVWSYMTRFLPMVDLLGFLPYWIVLVSGGSTGSTGIVDTAGPSHVGMTFVKALRLLRIFRFEKYTHAFTSFDDIFSRNYDVLSVTFLSSLLLWIFFGALLYLTERDNPDPEMAANYNSVPQSMWMTLLNLSGEAPLAQYSLWGKIATGILGLFATAIFGIPVGILGGGFEEVVDEETEDDDREIGSEEKKLVSWSKSTHGGGSGSGQPGLGQHGQPPQLGTAVERWCYQLVNGVVFEVLVYGLIFVAIAIGVLQTVKGHDTDFETVEAWTVYAFTVEYLLRFIGVGADRDFACPFASSYCGAAIVSRLQYIISFYSLIDLLAIVPFYIALAVPSSVVDEYNDYLRMARIIRLLKLDKYVPSFTLIDDVIRYKWNSLKVAGYAALTLWISFAGLLYLFEYTDSINDIDPVPAYGCDENCTMMDRFRNYFDSFYYTGVHLTGDYPITTYDWPAKFVNFFMVVAGVGVVSIPSGLIANGFVDVVQSKNKSSNSTTDESPATGTGTVVEGDDWYEEKYRALKGIAPPNSPYGPTVDKCQLAVNEFLNGRNSKDDDDDDITTSKYTPFALGGRIFIFTVIIANIVAVLVESIPHYDQAVGNEPGNFFDVFESFSIGVFTLEYLLRLFCAPKNREALYSTTVYAQTFFGIVDFLSTAPWYIEELLLWTGTVAVGGDTARVFRIFRIFRILQLEDFVTAFSKLDNVFRASKDVLKATGLLAVIIWIGGGSLFYIIEQNNPNWRSCDDSIPLVSNTTTTTSSYVGEDDDGVPGCYDFASTQACNDYYPGMCDQKVFVNMPNTLYMTAVFLGGEWGVTDFTWAGRILCIIICYLGITLYSIPAGIFFEKFGTILGFDEDEDDDDDDDEEVGGEEK